MKISDEAEFGAMLSTLGTVFGVEVEPAMIETYFAALDNLSLRAVGLAITAAIKTCEFMPRPVALRRLAGERSPAEMAAGAWEIAIKLARNIQDAEHPDPVAEQAVKRLGGWRAIGLVDDDRLVWVRKEFLELYLDGATGEPAREMLAEQHRPEINAKAEAVVGELAGKMMMR